MVNERRPPRRSFRESILPAQNQLNEDGMPASLLNIETIEQLQYWLRRDPDAVVNSLADIKRSLTETTDAYNELVTDREELMTNHEKRCKPNVRKTKF